MVAARHDTHDERCFFGQTASEFTQRLQAALRDELAGQQCAGYAIYSLDELGNIYKVLPDASRIPGNQVPDETSATHAIQ